MGMMTSSFFVSSAQYEQTRQRVKAVINEQCIWRAKAPGEVLPGKVPGSTYRWMFSLRRRLYRADFLTDVCRLFLHDMENAGQIRTVQVAGAETAATPLIVGLGLVAAARGYPLNGFVVRKEQKEYGHLNWIEGEPLKDVPVLLFDDLCNSTTSLAHANRVCDSQGFKTIGAHVIVNKTTAAMPADRLRSDLYLPVDFRVKSLFNLDDFNLSKPSH